MSPGKKKADIWTLVTFAGFAIVIVFLIFPLFDVFKIQFSGQEETKVPSLSNWKEFFSRAYLPEGIRAFDDHRAVHYFFRGFIRHSPRVFHDPIQDSRHECADDFVGAGTPVSYLHRRLFVDHDAGQQWFSPESPRVHRHQVAADLRADRHHSRRFAAILSFYIPDARRIADDHRPLPRGSVGKSGGAIGEDFLLGNASAGVAFPHRRSPHRLYDVVVELRHASDHRGQLSCPRHRGLRAIHERDQREPGNGFDRLHRPHDVRGCRHRAANLGVFAP